MSEKTIAFIGGGNMARSLIGGLIADRHPATRLRIAEPDAERRKALIDDFDVQAFQENATAIRGADVIMLAVKPARIADVARELAPHIRDQKSLVISVAAGVRSADINRWLGGESPVVRAMPNTPALVQTGATALFANEQVSEEQRNLAESILRAVGMVVWLTDEQDMNTVTAISGSGPAYFFLTMEAMQAAGESMGLDARTAHLLTLETALGAARMALESPEDVDKLKRRVTSPGGTTAAAIGELEDGDLAGLYRRALRAAAHRAEELGNELGDQ
ncbi:pyrroline-5-carboxylate reductase [Spiribacter vilamensis]|uniref:Pyrroline-5-carboxylate reductase n=1 Tax=Spiribacter vilamensis TaxID=531306 RepID=A0A4Q8D1I7_9GAMM|nr:pyrroline-5-carboxylate reductase [Spiribacter vilamensis]RZU99219.1 pyrroline-5-carboxylate reductase [Spiribacter vilamensis]TVO61793.1 pyrroline-5-carboxylate reductase [Spiribacter vilamensis]